MFSKVTVLFCGQILLVNLIGATAIAVGANGSGAGDCCGSAQLSNPRCAPITTSGGGFIVSSSSPINPSGLYVLSENKIDGKLGINGQIPFLAAVALEGEAPSSGNSAVAYKCGSCEIGITAENQNAASPRFCGAGLAGPGLGYGVGAGLGFGGVGYGAGLGATEAGLGYGAAGQGYNSVGLGYGNAASGLGYGGFGAGLGGGCFSGYGYGLGTAAY